MKPGNRQQGFVEMVPIHTKHSMALIDGRKDSFHI